MSHKIYNKLVRDNIPNILKEQGVNHQVEYLSNEEVAKYVLMKFAEELSEACDELQECNTENIATELADLISVIFKIGEVWGIDPEEIMEIESTKTEINGGFYNNCILKWIEEKDDDEETD